MVSFGLVKSIFYAKMTERTLNCKKEISCIACAGGRLDAADCVAGDGSRANEYEMKAEDKLTSFGKSDIGG